MIFDPKREFLREGASWLPRFINVQSFQQFSDVLRKKWRNKAGFQIVYTPTFGNEKVELDKIAKYLFELQSAYKNEHFAKITLFVDEAQEGIPAGTSRFNPSHGVLLISKMGRDRGINLIVASQRVNMVDIGVRANLSDWYVFRLAELSDIKSASEVIRDKEKLLKMANFQYFHRCESGTINFFSKK